MKIKKQIPLVTTSRLPAQKEFYVGHLGFRATLDSPEYLSMVASDGVTEVGFMPPGEEGQEFQRCGLTLCLEVPSADIEYERLTRAGLSPTRPLKDNPWGDRSFAIEDPAGVSVYIYHLLPQAAEAQT